jgi:hypothetical protein
LSTCYFAGSAASQPLVGMLLEHSNPASQKIAGLAALTAGRLSLCPVSACGIHVGGIDRIVADQRNINRHGTPMKQVCWWLAFKNLQRFLQ